MGRVFKFLLFAVLITGAVWLAAVIYWQETNRLISTRDVVIYMLLLPVAVIGGYFLAKWGIDRARSGSSASSAASAQPAAAVKQEPSKDDAERRLSFEVLASALLLPCGQAGGEVWSTVASGEAGPKPDDELSGKDSPSVFAARAELQVDEITEAARQLQEQLAKDAGKPEYADMAPRPASVRVLGLIGDVMSRIGAVLDENKDRLAPPRSPSQSNVQNNAQQRQSLDALPRLRVFFPVLPEWPAFDRDLIAAWVNEKLKNFGVPAAQIVAQAISAHSAEDFVFKLDQRLVALAREQRADLVLALAADSNIDPQVVMQWRSAGVLYSDKNTQIGRMPGEGAAAVLLAPVVAAAAKPASAQPASGDGPPPRLHRAALVQRQKPADEQGRVSGDVCAAVAAQAIAVSNQAAAKFETVVSDVDQRGSRTGEFYSALLNALPELDPGSSSCGVGIASGEVGLARALACVVVAADRVKEKKTPALVLTVSHPVDRLAWAIVPGLVPEESKA